MLLILIPFALLMYSITVQLFRFIKNNVTKGYKKTPEYQEFENELFKLINNS